MLRLKSWTKVLKFLCGQEAACVITVTVLKQTPSHPKHCPVRVYFTLIHILMMQTEWQTVDPGQTALFAKTCLSKYLGAWQCFHIEVMLDDKFWLLVFCRTEWNQLWGSLQEQKHWITSRICVSIFCDIPSEHRHHKSSHFWFVDVVVLHCWRSFSLVQNTVPLKNKC